MLRLLEEAGVRVNRNAVTCSKMFEGYTLVPIVKPPKRKGTPVCRSPYKALVVTDSRRFAFPIITASAEATEQAIRPAVRMVNAYPKAFEPAVLGIYPLYSLRRFPYVRSFLEETLDMLRDKVIYANPTVQQVMELFFRVLTKRDPKALNELDSLAKRLIIKKTEEGGMWEGLAGLAVLAEGAVPAVHGLLKREFGNMLREGLLGAALQIAHEGAILAVASRSFDIENRHLIDRVVKMADNRTARKLELLKIFLEEAERNKCYALDGDVSMIKGAVMPDGKVVVKFGAHAGTLELRGGEVVLTYIDHNADRAEGLVKYLRRRGFDARFYRSHANPTVVIRAPVERARELFRDLTATTSLDMLDCFDAFEASSYEELIERKRACIREAFGVDTLC